MKSFFRKADWIAEDIAEAHASRFDEGEARDFEETHRSKGWFGRFRLMLDMLLDKSFHLRPSTYIKLAGAVAYFVIPTDMIPDVLPGIGFIDDIWVMTVVLSSVSDEVERYLDQQG